MKWLMLQLLLCGMGLLVGVGIVHANESYSAAVQGISSLQGYWRLNETSGTVFQDSKGSNNGIFTGSGVTYLTDGAIYGSSDTAVTFTGGTGYGTVSDAADSWTSGGVTETTQEFALEGWVYPPNNPDAHKLLFGFRNDSDADFYVLQLSGSNALEARFRNEFSVTFDLTGTMTANTWNHIVFQRKGDLLVLYINGEVMDVEQGVYGLFPTGDHTLQIANSNSSTASLAIDEVALYNAYLDVDDVKEHYNLGANQTSRSYSLTPTGSRWWGAFTQGFPDYPASPAELIDFIDLVNGVPHVVNVFQAWGDGSSFEVVFGDMIRSRDATMMVTWMPSGTPSSDYALANILAGDFDSYITTFAERAAAWDHPVLLRFAHEMNGNGYYAWHTGVNGNTEEEFVQVWQKVHGMFETAGADNVQWVWCPNVTVDPDGFPTPIEDLYPGDAYVDWTCLDGYNNGTNAGGTWATFTEIFQSTYDFIMTLAPDKPMLIGEFGAVEQGGDKAEWITEAFLTEIPGTFPNIKGVVWFDENGTYDWRVNSSGEALAAFQAVVANSAWDGIDRTGNNQAGSGSSNSNEVGRSEPRPPGCSEATPAGVPDLFQIDAGATQVRLYFAPVTNQLTSYFVAYGHSSGDFRYGVEVPATAGGGVQALMIRDLDPNMAYHFQVRAGHGCQPGDWSNEMRIITAKAGSKGAIIYYKNFLVRILSLFPKAVNEL